MVPETVLGHYRLLHRLGQGGMGEVYAAEDLRLHRTVALKILPGGVAADPDRRKRFEREAQAVAALNHPNIVTLHSVEEAGDVIFLTMEAVEGQTLKELLNAGRRTAVWCTSRPGRSGDQHSDDESSGGRRGAVARERRHLQVIRHLARWHRDGFPQIFGFNMSQDGRLAVSRGNTTRDVVLITAK